MRGFFSPKRGSCNKFSFLSLECEINNSLHIYFFIALYLKTFKINILMQRVTQNKAVHLSGCVTKIDPIPKGKFTSKSSTRYFIPL